jgi:mevalonate kinase
MRRPLIVAALVVGVVPALEAQWGSRYSEERTAQLDARRSVLVEEDGSGDITVRRVGGSFTVRRDGSGGIHTTAVEGTISVPSRYSRSGRRYSMIRMD